MIAEYDKKRDNSYERKAYILFHLDKRGVQVSDKQEYTYCYRTSKSTNNK